MPAQVGTKVRSATHSWLGAVAVKSRRTRSGWRGGARVGLGGADSFPPPYAGDPSVAHQPGDLIAADVMPGAAGGLPQFASTVDPVIVLPQLRHDRSHHRIPLGPCRGGPRLGRVVGARGHRHACAAQDRADGLDPELVAVGVDEGDYFLCWRSSSAPKKLAAVSHPRARVLRFFRQIPAAEAARAHSQLDARPGAPTGHSMRRNSGLILLSSSLRIRFGKGVSGAP